MVRQLIFDTETTGLSPENDHRIIEIALLEVVNMKLTGKKFHCYLNPGRRSDPKAFSKHRLTDGFLKNKQLFEQIADDLLNFIGSDRLIAHNAQFDMKFLNMELSRINRRTIPLSQSFCTKALANIILSPKNLSLDTLCDFFSIDRQSRNKRHGALIDCHLLYQVYCELKTNINKKGSKPYVSMGAFSRIEGRENPMGKDGLLLNKTSTKYLLSLAGPSFITKSLLEKINRENEPSQLQPYYGPDLCYGFGTVGVYGTVVIDSCIMSATKNNAEQRVRNHQFLVIDEPCFFDCVIGGDMDLGPITFGSESTESKTKTQKRIVTAKGNIGENNKYIYLSDSTFTDVDRRNPFGKNGVFFNKTFTSNCMLATGTKISVISKSLYEKINSENEPVELLSYEGDDMFCIGYGVVKICGAVFIKQCMFSGKKILKDHLFLVIEGSPVYDCVIGIDIMGKIPELNPIPEDLMASLVLEEGENSTNTKTLLIREQRKKGEKDFPGVILGWEAIAALTKK